MVRVDSDTVKQRVILTYEGTIGTGEMERVAPIIAQALDGMKPGFSLVTDMTALEEMDFACARYVEQVMDWCDEKEIGIVVRVIPDPAKDIGFTIMSRFHYRPEVKLQTCATLAEAVRGLE